MKTKAAVRIVLLSAIALVLTGVLIAGIAYGPRSLRSLPSIVSAPDSDEPISEATAFAADKVEELHITWAAGRVEIIPADQAEITVTEDSTSGNHPMVVRQGGSKLIVEFCAEKWNTGSMKQKNLRINVPRDWRGKKLEFSGASADLQVGAMYIEKVEISTASGTCAFEDAETKKLEMSTASGDLDFTGTFDRLEFDGASAACRLTLRDAPSEIKMDTMSGDLEVALPDNIGFTLDKSTLSGSFSSDFATCIENGKIVSGDGACKIAFNSLSGNVAIHRK